MSPTLSWEQIVWRLTLTLVAGTVIGINRRERGRPAGLRTTCLVSLAASLAMIQMNLLLASNGKAADSFAVMDVARLPLGILSGMGFIGAGAILRRDRMVLGVTTAATLWFVTMVGLCFGGGQIGLGLAGLGIGMVVLWCFQWFEDRLSEVRIGTLRLVVAGSREPREIEGGLRELGFRITSWGISPESHSTVTCEIHWSARPDEKGVPSFVSQVAKREDIVQLEWSEVLHA